MPATTAVAQDKEFLKLLKDTLEQVYRDGIDRFLQLAIAEDGTVSGAFSDSGRVFSFSVGLSGIRYQPIPHEKLDSRTAGFVAQMANAYPFAQLGNDAYTASLLSNLMRSDAKGKKSQCRRGYSCGAACINNEFECRISRLNMPDKRKVAALVDGAKVVHKIGGGPLLTALLGAAAIAATSFAVGAAVGAYGAGINRPPNPNRAAPPPGADPKPQPEKPKRERKKKVAEPEQTAEEAKAAAEGEVAPPVAPDVSPRSPTSEAEQLPIDFDTKYIVEREVIQTVAGSAKGIVELDPKTIRFAPELMQYKMPPGISAREMQQYREQGETGSLADVQKWNPDLAGVMQGWRVPKTFTHKGQTYNEGEIVISNGHNRLALAQRLGAEKVAVRLLDVPTWQEARTISAMTNVAEGRGTAKDAANLFRSLKLTPEELAKRGLSMREKTAELGLGMAGLNSRLWNMVADPTNPNYGSLSERRAAMIGRVKEPDLQDEIWANIRDRKGVTDSYVEALATTAQHRLEKGRVSVESEGGDQGSLFDVQKLVANLADRAEVDGYFESQINREASFWNKAAKPQKLAEILEREGAGAVDLSRAEEVSQQTAVAKYLYRKAKLTVNDPSYETVNRMLDGMGDRLKELRTSGATKAQVDDYKQQSWSELRQILEGMIK